MTFNSWQFLIFLPVVVLLYWIVPNKFRWILLLIASYIFYLFWNVKLIFLILFTTGISYISAILINKSKNDKTKKLWLIITLISCLGVLFFFKYFTFIANSIIDLINLGSNNIPQLTFSLLLPVGISFYTFQTLSYVIDVYRGKINPEYHLGYYALYVVYFPQLVAGPIERPENLLPQLRQERTFDSNDLFTGLRISIVGFFKKVVIADTVAIVVNSVYNNLGYANGITIIIATVLFAIQIYCDFSGYTDIAIGVARMMGIKLNDNFNQPYLATSIRDFWKRWHISLTSWFTDYVYIPLGGSRCKFYRWAINVMIVFLLSGLWHGAAWTFVIWGLIHGVYQIIGKLKAKLVKRITDKKQINIDDNPFVIGIRRVITFTLVCFAWIFFRANSISDCGIILGKLFTDWHNTNQAFNNSGLTITLAIEIGLMILMLPMLHKVLEYEPCVKNGEITQTFMMNKLAYMFLLVAVILAWIGLYISGGSGSSFIYFQF